MLDAFGKIYLIRMISRAFLRNNTFDNIRVVSSASNLIFVSWFPKTTPLKYIFFSYRNSQDFNSYNKKQCREGVTMSDTIQNLKVRNTNVRFGRT